MNCGDEIAIGELTVPEEVRRHFSVYTTQFFEALKLTTCDDLPRGWAMRAISFAATDTAFHGFQRLCEALLPLVGANVDCGPDRVVPTFIAGGPLTPCFSRVGPGWRGYPRA